MEDNAEYDIKMLFAGVIPQCQDEMNALLNKYTPYFFRCDDRPGFVMEAGPFGILKFTQRTLHQIWILGFAANQALHSYSTMLAILRRDGIKLDTRLLDIIKDQEQEDTKYQNLIRSVYELAEIEEIALFSWPSIVPKPENRKPSDLDGASTFDLICMSGAYIFLHEIKHIAFSLDNNRPSSPQDEEIECDFFAQSMMLDKLSVYAEMSGYDLVRLNSKRAMSISLALFYMLVIIPIDCWAGTSTHPSIVERIESIIEKIYIHNDDIFWLYTSSLFLAHLRFIDKNHFEIEFKTFSELAMGLIKKIDEQSNK